jgi:hypothetical protein
MNRPGKRTIFISLVTALVSMYLGWAEMFFYKRTGDQQGLFLLLLFWLYPCTFALFNWKINKIWGSRMAIGAFISSVLVMIIIGGKSVFGFNVGVGTGAWLFLASSIALWFGIYRYTSSYDLRNP